MKQPNQDKNSQPNNQAPKDKTQTTTTLALFILSVASKHPNDIPKDPEQAQGILDHELNQARENPRQAYQNALNCLRSRR